MRRDVLIGGRIGDAQQIVAVLAHQPLVFAR